MNNKKYLSTGEAAQILNVSRSTVAWKFDSGELTGKRNPITQERRVSRKSLDDLLQNYGLPPLRFGESRRVLFVTADLPGHKVLIKTLAKMDGFETHCVSAVSEALRFCRQHPPELVVIGRDLGEIPCAYLAQQLRKSPEFSDVKVLCCAKDRKAPLCLDARCKAQEHCCQWHSGLEIFNEKISTLLQQNDNNSSSSKIDLPRERRQAPRRALNIPVQLEIFTLCATLEILHGEAFVVNLSEQGACLSQVRTHKGVIPCFPFQLLIKANRNPLENWNAHCRVAWLRPEEALKAGVRFTGLTKHEKEKLHIALSQNR